MIATGRSQALPLGNSSSSPIARGPLEARVRFAICPKARPSAKAQVTANAAVRYNGREEGNAMQVNDKAPAFNLEDQDGKKVALKDFAGKTVVLFFYPKADTPG